MTNPQEAPLYTVSQVANIVGEKTSTVGNWAFGTKRFKRVIQPPTQAERRLSFVNLVEIHVLHVIRKRKQVDLSKVRSAIRHLEQHWNDRHPLATVDMQTDGVDLIVEKLGNLINASQDGQRVIREAVEASLTRIERDPEDGALVRFFPVTRPVIDDDAPKLVATDPRHRFGRPFLVSSGVPTTAVYGRWLAGESEPILAEDYETTEEEIAEALRFHSRMTNFRDVA